jgi:Xaa-Pro aminopeptidase
VIPGYTNTEDLEYLLWEKAINKGLEVWFPPDVNLQRNGEKNKFITGKILPGDLLHCDYGIKYLDLCTDTQRVAYVGKNCQNRVPEFLNNLMKAGNKVQDILARNIKVGLSGNQVLKRTLEECADMNLKAQIYSHPIGLYGHGAGPAIGMFDNQENVPVKGELKINDYTCYAMELNASKNIPEWGDREYFIFLEQTVGIKNNEVIYFDGRQEEIIFI